MFRTGRGKGIWKKTKTFFNCRRLGRYEWVLDRGSFGRRRIACQYCGYEDFALIRDDQLISNWNRRILVNKSFKKITSKKATDLFWSPRRLKRFITPRPIISQLLTLQKHHPPSHLSFISADRSSSELIIETVDQGDLFPVIKIHSHSGSMGLSLWSSSSLPRASSLLASVSPVVVTTNRALHILHGRPITNALNGQPSSSLAKHSSVAAAAVNNLLALIEFKQLELPKKSPKQKS